MPYQPLTIHPGVNSQATPMLLGQGGFTSSQFIRFKDGLLQKLGGWFQLIATPVQGTARAITAFQDLNNNDYLGIGTNELLYIYTNGILYNVTPIQQTDDLSNPFSTTINSNIVTVTDVGFAPNAGDWIYIVNPATVGGLVLQGSYQVDSIPLSTTYTLTAASNATSTVPSGGTAALFNTTMSSPTVTVTLANHGYSIGQIYTVYISTTVGGLTLLGQYGVVSVVNANQFTITPGGTASSTTSGSENGGQIRINYLISSGSQSSIPSGGFYGLGRYGIGVYGTGDPNAEIQLARLWSLGVWGQDLLSTYTNGTLYVWLSEDGLVNNNSTVISGAPLNINAGIFVAMPEQQVVALGASDGSSSTLDPLLVRFSDVSDYTDWVASAINQAGSFRLSRGSQIIGGLQGPLQGYIWTDVGFWVMQYIQPPFVYSFLEIGRGCGLIGQNAAGILGNNVYWMGKDNFFMFDGSAVRVLPCAIWDIIFGGSNAPLDGPPTNLATNQAEKIIAMPNSSFNEIGWAWPSTTGPGLGENDSYVKYNIVDNTWDYGSFVRTAWTDVSIFGQPIGVDGAGLMQQHEVALDDNGNPMVCSARTGWIKMSEGTLYSFLERLIPDFVFSGSPNFYAPNQIKLTIYTANYPSDTPYVQEFTITNSTEYVVVRQRGRLVSIKVESDDLGSFWRLGQILLSLSQSGRN